MQIAAYLNFDGQCEEAFGFYAKVLRTKRGPIMRFEGTPAQGQVSEEWRNKVMHTSLSMGDQTIMGSDGMPSCYAKPQGFSVAISLKDTAEAERIFAELSEGGTVTMPLAETFWAARFGALSDRYGIPWMINCETS